MPVSRLTLLERQHRLAAPGPEQHRPHAAAPIPVKNELPLQLGNVKVVFAFSAERQLRHVRDSDEETVAIPEDGEGRTGRRLVFADWSTALLH
jgi:hypothetical protein